ncbi:FAD-dependent oxidoreductase [Chelatococcus sambhunathii]|uniref:Tryptophan 2-monooxygenase n=1 Tax=Chelatococcus sambhunathii TaxID=363953 RepID=A0ABU1DGB7_9HYPH|nr:NAD(P)/FAD-dependent oxidoreductase [Chelatococcus sambhunathii]MDR4307090.1 FAD-dependent oxidoreductase [Chelatococcus sambhunathii]
MAGSHVDVAVVGGGAAGIAAARRLRDAGRDVLLLEARERLGGRAFTRLDPAGGPLDLGCGWLHSGDVNPWTEIAGRAGLKVDRSPAPWSRPGMGLGFSEEDLASFQAAREAFHDQLGELLRRGDAPASDALEPGGRWNALLSAIYTYVSGGEIGRISARDLVNYGDTGFNYRVAGGYGALIAGHVGDAPVALGTAVSRVDHTGASIRLETAKGTIEAEKVVIALPSALIAEGAVAFTPDLPQKREAAAGLPLGLADKVYFMLDRPDGFEADSRAFGRRDRVATAAYHFRPSGRPLVEAYFGGDCADALEREGEPAFADFALAELSGLFGEGIRARLSPLPTHLWRADPFARGSYSFALPGRAGDRKLLAEPVDGRLFFAGEACSEEDYSTAHGAYRTGIAAAEAILAGE